MKNSTLAYVHAALPSVSEEWEESLDKMLKYLGLLLSHEEFTPLYQLVTQDTKMTGAR
jgi:hypothetical protein